MNLLVSIVLFESDPAELHATLSTLGATVNDAIARGALGGVRVVLTDNSPRRQGEDDLERFKILCGPRADVRYDFVGRNLGFGAGHNRAFAVHAEGFDYVLVANPDLEFDTDSLAEGLKFMATHPRVGLVAPALREDGDVFVPACRRYPDLLTLFFRTFGPLQRSAIAQRRSSAYECRDWDASQPRFNPAFTSGCCMLFRISLYRTLGGFDRRYFLYFEDYDLSQRAGKAGASAYCPTMRVRHHGGGVVRKGPWHVWLYLQSAWTFFWQHGWRLA